MNLYSNIRVNNVPRGHSNWFYSITSCKIFRKYSILLIIFDMNQCPVSKKIFIRNKLRRTLKQILRYN